jgi:hypothetical protein
MHNMYVANSTSHNPAQFVSPGYDTESFKPTAVEDSFR